MKRGLGLIALAIASFAQATVSSDIDHQYKRWGRAALSNDVDTICSILAPDYTLHTYTGVTIGRKDYEASLRKRKASGTPATAYVTRIAKVTVAGKKALVISDETSATVSKDPVTNQKVKLVHIHRYLDTWVKGQTWRLQSTVTQVESTTVVKL